MVFAEKHPLFEMEDEKNYTAEFKREAARLVTNEAIKQQRMPGVWTLICGSGTTSLARPLASLLC